MIKILTDSVASIPADVAREAGIDVVTLFVNREGCEYADSEMDLDAFYADIYDMVDNIPTSSQPSQHTLETVFEEAARAGDEVLGIFISSELSGTYEGAVRAARAVKARNIDFTYVIVRSGGAARHRVHPLPVHARNAHVPATGRAHRQRGGAAGQPHPAFARAHSERRQGRHVREGAHAQKGARPDRDRVQEGCRAARPEARRGALHR